MQTEIIEEFRKGLTEIKHGVALGRVVGRVGPRKVIHEVKAMILLPG